VKNESEKPKKVTEVIEFVKKSGGIEYAHQTMNKFHREALALLNNLPESVYKTSLQQLVQFTIDRSN
jgi:octaprenyl-diphosphate synthase